MHESLFHQGRPNPALPSKRSAAAQTEWLRGARARLLRSIDVAHRRSVVEIGCGWGMVARELADRAGVPVLAFDHDRQALRAARCEHATGQQPVRFIQAAAERLPIASGSVDLVFAQCVFLWLRAPRAATAEVARVLRPGGVLAAIEPDYGGIIEAPDELAVGDIWQAALRRAGANPQVGRELPGWFSDVGFRVTTRLLDQVRPPSAARFDMLREVPLTDEERSRVDKAAAASARAGQRAVAHLPFFLVTAELA